MRFYSGQAFSIVEGVLEISKNVFVKCLERKESTNVAFVEIFFGKVNSLIIGLIHGSFLN